MLEPVPEDSVCLFSGTILTPSKSHSLFSPICYVDIIVCMFFFDLSSQSRKMSRFSNMKYFSKYNF